MCQSFIGQQFYLCCLCARQLINPPVFSAKMCNSPELLPTKFCAIQYVQTVDGL